MGPRHFCRGILAGRVVRRAAYSASMGPRHFCRGIRPAVRERRRQGLTGFNGATAFLPWNHHSTIVDTMARSPASMGPRHFCRGIRSRTVVARVVL